MNIEKPQVSSEHYFKTKYDTKGRFCSYWHQINEIMNSNPYKLLEVGPGNGFVSDYLKKRGFNVITCDIDKELNPDILGSVLNLPISDNQFDVVACFEVLEHLPYENIPKALYELARVSKDKVIFSVPDRNRILQYLIHIPKIGKLKILLPVPTIKKKEHEFDGQHYWEIGKKYYPLKEFTMLIEESGLKVEKSYRVFENPSHRFFICKKK